MSNFLPILLAIILLIVSVVFIVLYVMTLKKLDKYQGITNIGERLEINPRDGGSYESGPVCFTERIKVSCPEPYTPSPSATPTITPSV